MAPRSPLALGALLGAAQILAWGGSFFLLAVLAEPIRQDTGWSLTWIYGALTAGVAVSALLSPTAGDLVARGHGRRLLVASGWTIAAGMALVGLAPHYAVFLLGWCVIGAGMAGGLYDPLFATLATLYGRDARAAINAVTLVGGLASAIAWPVQAWLVQALGWRASCWAYAAVLALAIGPLYWLALPRGGGRVPVADAGGPAAAPLAVLPPGLYRLLSGVFSIAAILMTAMSVQLIVLLQGAGHSGPSAIAMAALLGPSMVLVRVASLAFRRLHPAGLALVSALCVALGLLLVAAAPLAAAAGIVCYGIGNGLRALVRGTLPLALLPQQAVAGVMGRLARSSLLCQALTPLACGFLLTQVGPAGTLWLLTLLAVANVGLSLLLYRQVARLRALQPAGVT